MRVCDSQQPIAIAREQLIPVVNNETECQCLSSPCISTQEDPLQQQLPDAVQLRKHVCRLRFNTDVVGSVFSEYLASDGFCTHFTVFALSHSLYRHMKVDIVALQSPHRSSNLRFPLLKQIKNYLFQSMSSCYFYLFL